mgnify:CR=1 FL=1
MTQPRDVLLVTAANGAAATGNHCTAQQWADILRGLGHRATVAAAYDGQEADVLVALHGVKSRAADRLIEVMGKATTMQELQDAARAFDRVVMWNHWQVPDLYADTENFSYWNRFGIPKTSARYFVADTLISGFIEFGPWPLWTWWDKGTEAR